MTKDHYQKIDRVRKELFFILKISKLEELGNIHAEGAFKCPVCLSSVSYNADKDSMHLECSNQSCVTYNE